VFQMEILEIQGGKVRTALALLAAVPSKFESCNPGAAGRSRRPAVTRPRKTRAATSRRPSTSLRFLPRRGWI
jgi:hypothetical protein